MYVVKGSSCGAQGTAIEDKVLLFHATDTMGEGLSSFGFLVNLFKLVFFRKVS